MNAFGEAMLGNGGDGLFIANSLLNTVEGRCRQAT